MSAPEQPGYVDAGDVARETGLVCEALEDAALALEQAAREEAAAWESLRFQLASIRENGTRFPPLPPQDESSTAELLDPEGSGYVAEPPWDEESK